MKISIHYEGCPADQKITDLLEKKIAPELDKYLSHISEDDKQAVITISREEYYFIVKFDLWLPEKRQIFAKEENKDLLTAIYSLRDDVEAQLDRYFSK